MILEYCVGNIMPVRKVVKHRDTMIGKREYVKHKGIKYNDDDDDD